jgi:hypothetical protein
LWLIRTAIQAHGVQYNGRRAYHQGVSAAMCMNAPVTSRPLLPTPFKIFRPGWHFAKEEKFVKFFILYYIGKIFYKIITFEHWLCVIICAAQAFKDKLSITKTTSFWALGMFSYSNFYSVIFSNLAEISAPWQHCIRPQAARNQDFRSRPVSLH